MKRFILSLAVLIMTSAAGYCASPIQVIDQSVVSVSSATSAANSAVTITITTGTSSGPYSSGYNTYISHIYGVAYSTGTIPVVTTPLACTSSNLGSIALRFPSVITAGTLSEVDLGFENNPLRSTSSGNVVLTCPATGAVQWAITVNYFQAP